MFPKYTNAFRIDSGARSSTPRPSLWDGLCLGLVRSLGVYLVLFGVVLVAVQTVVVVSSSSSSCSAACYKQTWRDMDHCCCCCCLFLRTGHMRPSKGGCLGHVRISSCTQQAAR